MKNSCLLFFIFLLVLTNANGQSFEVVFQVQDAATAKAVDLANIFITPCECGGPTDENGVFKTNLKKDQYQVVTSCIGYQNDTLVVELEAAIQLEIKLQSQGYQLDDVTVSGQSTRQNIERTVMGVQQLSANKITTLPTAIGEVDVLKSLAMLPGVGGAGEASNGLSIRGGSLDQNLVLLDNAPIFNPTHLFGLFSVFTPDAIGGVDLYRANMPAKYGGRIASVVDIKVKNPDADQFTMAGGIGMVSSRLAVETPIIKDKLSVLAATRVSFNDFVFGRIERLKDTKANFVDGTLKLKYQANEKNSFYYTGFYSQDFYELDITSKISAVSATTNQYDYSTFNNTLNWLSTINDQSFLRTTLVLSDYRPQILFPQADTDNKIVFESRIQYRSLQSELFKEIDKKLTWSVGLQLDQTTLSPGDLLPGNEESIEAVSLPHENNLELSAFTNLDWVPSERWAFSLGLRYSNFFLLGPYQEAQYENEASDVITSIEDFSSGSIVQYYGGPEPRVGLRWKASDNTSLKASYALTRQYLQNIYNSTTPLPTSRWKTSDRYIAPQVGHTYSFGVYQNVKNNKITISAEAYYRSINNVLDYKPGADFFLQDFIERDVVQGDARTYGLEFNFEKPEGYLNGWFNYTWSRSLRQFDEQALSSRINNNEWFASDFDRPHVFNGTLNCKANDFNTFSFNFVYQTGRPYTIPNAVFVIDNIPVPVFLERNNSRLPDYHRLDFSWRIHNISTNKAQRWKGDWILTIYNLYNRQNAFNRYFTGRNRSLGANFVSGNGALAAYQLSIFSSTIISLAYSFKFQ